MASERSIDQGIKVVIDFGTVKSELHLSATLRNFLPSVYPQVMPSLLMEQRKEVWRFDGLDADLRVLRPDDREKNCHIHDISVVNGLLICLDDTVCVSSIQ